MTLMVDFLGNCDILFSVMREQIEMEEVFENEELFAAELEAERVERERKFAAEMFWFIQKRRQQGDWS